MSPYSCSLGTFDESTYRAKISVVTWHRSGRKLGMSLQTIFSYSLLNLKIDPDTVSWKLTASIYYYKNWRPLGLRCLTSIKQRPLKWFIVRKEAKKQQLCKSVLAVEEVLVIQLTVEFRTTLLPRYKLFCVPEQLFPLHTLRCSPGRNVVYQLKFHTPVSKVSSSLFRK